MAKPNARTYRRLLHKIIIQMGQVQPGEDPRRIAHLKRKFHSYELKIKELATK